MTEILNFLKTTRYLKIQSSNLNLNIKKVLNHEKIPMQLNPSKTNLHIFHGDYLNLTK